MSEEAERIDAAIEVLRQEGGSIPIEPDPLTDEELAQARIALAALETAIEVHGHISRNETREAVLALLRWADTLPKPELLQPVSPEIEMWRAQCGVCDAKWKVDKDESGRTLTAEPADNPGPHGTFCPDCRGRGMMAPGVLNWRFGA